MARRILILSSVVIIVLLISVFSYGFYSVAQSDPQATYTPANAQTAQAQGRAPTQLPGPTRQVKKTDLSPQSPADLKGTWIVMHPDGSLEEFSMLPSMFQAWKARLAATDRIVAEVAPSVIRGRHPPNATTWAPTIVGAPPTPVPNWTPAGPLPTFPPPPTR